MRSATSTPKLTVNKLPRYLCFEHCDSGDHLPKESKSINKVFDTLNDFSNSSRLQLRDIHQLRANGQFKKTKNILDKYPNKIIYSVDVGKRGGELGAYRLLYYVDPNNSDIAKVVATYIDTHK